MDLEIKKTVYLVNFLDKLENKIVRFIKTYESDTRKNMFFVLPSLHYAPIEFTYLGVNADMDTAYFYCSLLEDSIGLIKPEDVKVNLVKEGWVFDTEYTYDFSLIDNFTSKNDKLLS